MGALAIDLGHFTVVDKILFATFRLYSDNLLQATSSGNEVSKIVYVIHGIMTLKAEGLCGWVKHQCMVITVE